MAKKHRNRKRSILTKMLLYMFGALFVMFGILYATIFEGTLTDRLLQNSFDILDERVTSRKNILKGDMIQRWSNLYETVVDVDDVTADFLAENNATYSDLTVQSPLSSELLSRLSDSLIYRMRRNGVTGAFIILNGSEQPYPPTSEQTHTRAGLYLRDSDPSTELADNSDLMLERAPTKLSREKGITLDTFWEPIFTFTSDCNADYFYKPFSAAMDSQGAKSEDLGYWGKPFVLDSNSTTTAITYSVPLIAPNGVPYGVIGIDINLDFLAKQLPSYEINGDSKGSYVIAISSGTSQDFDNVVVSGASYKSTFGSKSNSMVLAATPVSTNSYSILSEDKSTPTVYACVQYLNLYNVNTPFESDKWALVATIDEAALLGFYKSMQGYLLVVLASTFLIGVFGVVVASVILTKPITQLSHKVRNSNPNRPVILDKINVAEIDELSSAIELLSSDVADNYSILSKIMSAAGHRVGAFESLSASNEVKYTDDFFNVLGIQEPENSDGIMPQEEFTKLLTPLMSLKEDIPGESSVYHIQKTGDISTWVKLQFIENGGRILGVASDVTTDILRVKKLEYERDYDLLTQLKNRRAFHMHLETLFKDKSNITVAAMIMLDLDNLKHVNDSYGHDIGDDYLRCAADVLRKFEADNVTCARMSGDEFYVFVKGDTAQEVSEIIHSIETGFRSSYFDLPDGQTIRVRCSAGISWYPKDSDAFLDLIKYADFAMYRIKHTTKGKFAEFELDNYERESFLLKNKEELNKLIDGSLVRYEFQIIASAVDGTVFAYEALMRPTQTVFATPLDVLSMAHSQSKLYEIECITWFKSLEAFAEKNSPAANSKLFINSIPNQLLSASDLSKFEEMYSDYLSRIVVELTEDEKPNSHFTRTKTSMLESWHAQIALDDFGSGYNGEAALLSVSPNYIKIDQTIVRSINDDAGRCRIVENIVKYANCYDIKVIGEGVETQEEMETLVKCGVHFLQGYYVSRPSPTLQDVPADVKQAIINSNQSSIVREDD